MVVVERKGEEEGEREREREVLESRVESSILNALIIWLYILLWHNIREEGSISRGYDVAYKQRVAGKIVKSKNFGHLIHVLFIPKQNEYGFM
ncbi:hypothetical protein NC651_003920 [Populus alba x Populus x berolinensis]|nr:hypothetical protein NC651_003920 [Populus alba x Populus x berolinensis]